MVRSLRRGQSWVVFLCALIVRLAATQLFQGLDAPPDAEANPDQVEYEQFAHQLSIGNGYARANGERTAARPPGTSLTLAPVYWLLGHSYLFGRVFMCSLSALTCVLAAAIARSLFGRGVGWVAGIWLALYPGHFYYATHFLSEVVFGFWLCLSMWLFLRSFDRLRAKPAGIMNASLDRLEIVGCGAALGMAALTRPQFVLILPFMTLCLLGRGSDLRRGLCMLAIQWIAAGSVILPWMIRNHSVLGRATITTIGGYTFWGANNETVLNDPRRIGSWIPVDSLIDDEHPVEGDEVERERATYRHGMRFVREHRADMPLLMLMKLWRLLSPLRETSNFVVFLVFAVAWVITGPLVIAGLWMIARSDRKAFLVLAVPLLVTLATTLVYYGSIRFRDSVAPVFILAAAYASWHVAHNLARRRDAHPLDSELQDS